MDIDATQVIDDINLNVAEESHHNDGCPVGFLKLLKQKNFEEKSFPIFEGVNKVGRGIACHVTLEAKTLSKEHCCIEVFHDDHFICDLGSSNKSRRNKMVLTPNVRYELNNNDVLTLADLKLVYIKSHAVHVGDSGSDTESLPESESMLPVSFESVTTGGAFKPQAADDDNDDDDDDPSSDILQPTQHAGGHLIGSHNQKHVFLEDSLRHVISENKEKESLADETVLETPPRVLLGANSGADFIPESDSETEADFQHFLKAATLEYNDADVEGKVKSRAVASNEPTQAYSIDIASETVAVVGSGSQPNSTGFPAETLVLSDADVAATQVFSASAQKSDSDSASTQVFSQFPVEILGSSAPSPLQSKMYSRPWNSTEQHTVAYNVNVDETRSEVDPAFPVALCDSKALEKSDLDQATQMYVEETQLCEGETAPVVKVASPVDEPHSLQKKIVQESNGSVINFSPQSASTQVFGLDAETSFLPTLVLETSDRLDADDNLMPPPLPAFSTTAVCSSSETLVRCTGLNSKRSRGSTDDVCTQVFSDKEVGQLLFEPTAADDLCTQVYEDTDWNLGGPSGAAAKSSTYTDDVCTQVYQDKEGNFGGSGVAAAAKSSACTDDICTQDYNTNQSSDFVLERTEPVSSTQNMSTVYPSIPTTSSLYANEISVTTDTVAVNEISEQALLLESDFLQVQTYQSELITGEEGRISDMLSESAVTVLDGETVEDRDSDNVTQIFDISNVEKNRRGKKSKEATKPNTENLHEGKKVNSDVPLGSDVSDTQPVTRKSTDQMQGRKLELSRRKTFLMQGKAQAINPDEETKGHSSSGSNQSFNNSIEKKNGEPEQDVSKHENAARQSKEKNKKIMNSEVTDDSGKSLEVHSERREMDSSSKALGRRTSMRLNKGKRPEDTEFQRPAEEKRKNKKCRKRLIKDQEPTGVETPSKKSCNDPEEMPLISKSSSEGLLSQSSRGTRDSEILDSSQLSDDDLPSLSSLIALNRIQDTTTRSTLSKDHEHRLAMIAENASVKPVCELESEEAHGKEKDVTEDEIMKKESGNMKKTRLTSKRNPRTETNILSKEGFPVNERNDQTADETMKKEPRNKKKMSLGSKEHQITEKKDIQMEERNDLIKDETTESGNKKKVSLGSKKNKRTAETMKMPSEDDSVVERKKDDYSDETSSGSQRWKNVKKSVTEKSLGKKHEESSSAAIEIPVRSEEMGSSDNSYLNSYAATLTKGNSLKLSGKLEMESDPSLSGDHSSKGRHQVWSAVTANENEVASLSQRKSCKPLAANINTSDENLVNSDPGIKLMTSRKKSCTTLASDFNVTTEVVSERSDLRKKSCRTLVAEFEDDLTSKESVEVLSKAELLQLSSELETESGQLADVEETKRTTKGRKRTTEHEVSGLSLRKKAKTAIAAAAAAVGEETEVKKIEMKLLTSAKRSCRTRACDLDEKVMMESRKEVERKTVAGQKSKETEDAGEKDNTAESKLTKKIKCRTLAAEKNVDAVEMAVTKKAKPVREETGSRRGKKTEPRVEEEQPSDRCDAPQEAASSKKESQNLTTSQGNVSSEKPQVNVEVEASAQRLQVTGRKGKKDTTLNETNKEDDVKKNNVGIDSKRLCKSRKPVKEEDSRSNDPSSHPKQDELIMTPDLAKGARRRTKSGVEPAFKPKVMFTGVVDENGQKTVKSLGGEMVESIYDCTHLVTDQVRRTVKFLCGVARGLPIVSPTWLEASQSAGRFLDPSEFLVSDIENEKKFNFNLEWTLREAAKRPLLLGLSVHVTENVRPDPKQMKDIIQCAGGKFVQELPRSFEDNLIIVTCSDKDLESCVQLEEQGIPVVSSEYIMMGILQQKLDADLFRLTTKKHAETVKRNIPETSAGSRKKQKK